MFRRTYQLRRLSTPWQRPFTSGTGTRSLDDRNKKIIQEIKDLEYQAETQKKRKEAMAMLDKLNQEDVQEVYRHISAETKRPRPQRMVDSDYLEKLRVKFLDTRPLQLESKQLLEHALVKQELDQQQQQQLAVEDYDQLIYVNALAKRPNEAEKALKLMEENGISPTTRSYNHLLDAYANTCDLESAINVFKRIKADDLQPDLYTYSTLIKAYIRGGKLDDAFIIFERMKKSELIPTQPIFANIISGCIKANQIDRAWDVFDSMRLSYHQPDEVSFTLMLQACAKEGEVERALNVFEDMIGNGLHPTDITFNILINACAKRPDYFDSAFDLLHQMQNIYGFQADLITYNTLLSACARKKHLERARDIFQIMMYDANQYGKDAALAPDSQTYTNLFLTYASYDPVTPAKKITQPDKSMDALVEHSLLSTTLPERRSHVVQEAKKLFEFVTLEKACDVTSGLLTAYLSVHIMQKQSNECADIYLNDFEKYNVERTPITFANMLRFCYNTRDADLAWRVWEDYQTFLEKRQALSVPSDQVKEGWAPDQQQQLALLMINTLARGNDLKNALTLLGTQFPKDRRPTFKELRPLYNKCIQLEDEDAVAEVKALCVRNRKYKPVDWRFRK